MHHKIKKYYLLLLIQGQKLKMAVFWVVAPCNLVAVYPGSIIRAMTTLMMEAASTSETSVNFYQTIRRYNPVDSYLYTRCRENLNSYLGTKVVLWYLIFFWLAVIKMIVIKFGLSNSF
jgi:hypothetical protein